MSFATEEHILVWMRDRHLATALCERFRGCGLLPTWAASLPEAVGALDRCFPAAVACTLDTHAPSLMDLETLLAYLTIGHRSITLPPIPIWALSKEAHTLADRIAELGLPIHLVPTEGGPEALAAEVVHHVLPHGGRAAPEVEDATTLYLSSDERIGFYLARYLSARGVPTRAVASERDAYDALQRGSFRALVADLPREFEGRTFLRRIATHWQGLHLVALADPASWLTRLPPHRLPPEMACLLPKPVRAETLERCLKRLLRIARPQRGRSVTAGYVGYVPPPV